jgi:hypothetical protein
MTRAFFLALTLLVLHGPRLARAQSSDAGAQSANASGPTQDKVAAPGADAPSGPAWHGPSVQLSYRLYSLKDWQGGGIVNSGALSGFFPTRYLRAGGGVEVGARKYEYGPSEALMSGNLFAGFQYLPKADQPLSRLVPYLVAVGEYGVLLGKRFHSTVTNTYRGVGFELGGQVRLVRNLHMGAGLSWMVYTMDNLRYDTFGMRLSIGL